MLKNVISINYQHQILLDNYMETILKTMEDCTGSNKSKYNDFIDICNLVIEYHNEYRTGTDTGNLYDFLGIIPTNIGIAAQGFLAGLENRRNVITVRAYRYMLTNAAYKLVDDLEDIQLSND